MRCSYAPFANIFFSSAPIDLEARGRIVLYGLFAYPIVEWGKCLRRRKRGK